MSINESCRFCSGSLRVRGTIAHSKLIFDLNDRDNVRSQLSKLGLVIENTTLRSFRICRKCCAVITRLLRDAKMLQKWKNEETETRHGGDDSSTDKRDREPTPSKAPRATEMPARSSVTKNTSTVHRFTQAQLQEAGCQTDSPQTASVGTQTLEFPHYIAVLTPLSQGTLSVPMRSIETPAMMASPSMRPETSSGFQALPRSSSTPMEAPGFRPSKRLCVQEPENNTIPEIKVEPLDSSYNDGDPVVKEESHMFGPRATYDNAKYIVFESCLRELFDTCPVCRGPCAVQRRRMGTYVAFSQRCSHCDYSRHWQSQPIVGSTPLGNLLLSAATYFTGASFFQLAKIFKAMQLQTFKYDTFRRHARSFLEPAIVHKWKNDQQILFQQLQQEGKVAVCGGLRVDSPGHSPKFGSYSLINIESDTIIDLQLVQSNEVDGNSSMEKEGLKRSLDLLQNNGLDVDYIVTERHPQIQKYLRERKITQYHDVWHFDKASMVKVDKILDTKRVVKNVGNLSHHYQTSSLKDFHSLIRRFTPKNVVFPFMGLLCRLYLAIMHYNENKDPASRKGECNTTANQTEINPTYHYVDALLKLVFDEVFENPAPFVDELKTAPVPDDLSPQCEGPSEEDIAACHVSCFGQGAAGNLHTVRQHRETPGASRAQTATGCPPRHFVQIIPTNS